MWYLIEDFFEQSWIVKLFVAWGWQSIEHHKETIEVAGERHPRPIDAEGWFTATGLPRGATRVKVTAADGTAVTTGWASL